MMTSSTDEPTATTPYDAYARDVVLDLVPSLAWCARPDGAAEFVNQRWCDYTGMSAEEACGWGWASALRPGDRRRMGAEWARIVASRRPGTIETALRGRDGTYRWFALRAAPALDESGTVVRWYGTGIDVDARRRVEEALRTGEAAFLEAVAALPGFVATMDAAGEVGVVTPAFLDYTGLGRAQVAEWGREPGLLHDDDRLLVMERWMRSAESGDPYEIEHRIRGGDGVHRWFRVLGFPVRDADGRVARWYVLHARVAGATAVREPAPASRLLVESIPGMITVHGRDGGLEYVNAQLLRYLGVQLTDLTTFGWAHVLHPDDIVGVGNHWSRAREAGEPMEVTFRMRRADGAFRWCQSRKEPFLDERGEIVRWFSLVWDVHERKEAELAAAAREQELRATQTALAHVMRVATMGELTASIAHEVRQPLAAVVNNANACLALLPSDVAALAEVRAALGDIVDDAYRASTVVDRMRRLAANAPIESERLDLRDVVTDVAALARAEAASRRVAMDVDLPDAPLVALGDRVQLQQVVLNLVMNAMDAMVVVAPAGRVLRLRAWRDKAGDPPDIVIAVRDTGPGFSPVDAARMFEAFYTTKPSGLGMGLTISRSIVAAHRGRLTAERNDGAGATFTVRLPAAPRD